MPQLISSEGLKPVNILIDARKLGDQGIGTYIENLVIGIQRLRAAGEINLKLSLLLTPGFRKLAENLCSVEFVAALANCQQILESAPKYSFNELVMMPIRQRPHFEGVALFHSPHFTLPYMMGVPSVVTIHDIIHLTNPESRVKSAIAKRLIHSALSRSKAVVTVSNASKQDILESFRCKEQKIKVIPNSVSVGVKRQLKEDVTATLTRYALNKEYLLYIGTDRPHKGFTELLKAYSSLSEEMRKRFYLFTVGRRFGDKTRALVREMGLERRVKFMGEVPASDLPSLYSGAQAVVVPSRAEGFGFCALEAMACGTPVICSDISALREVCGDCACYVDINDTQAFTKTLNTALLSEGDTKYLIEKALERSGQYSIERQARATVEVYEQVLGRKLFGLGQADQEASENRKAQGALKYNYQMVVGV